MKGSLGTATYLSYTRPYWGKSIAKLNYIDKLSPEAKVRYKAINLYSTGNYSLKQVCEIFEINLNEFNITGLHIFSLFSTEWVGAKLLILKPNQFFPEHIHPPSEKEKFPGKTEVLRGQWGEFYLVVPGSITCNPKSNPPSHRKKYIDIWHEIVIHPGDQYIISPNTWHWFQAGPEGAIVWSISSKLTDAEDKFKDPQVKRKTIIIDD